MDCYITKIYTNERWKGKERVSGINVFSFTAILWCVYTWNHLYYISHITNIRIYLHFPISEEPGCSASSSKELWNTLKLIDIISLFFWGCRLVRVAMSPHVALGPAYINSLAAILVIIFNSNLDISIFYIALFDTHRSLRQ